MFGKNKYLIYTLVAVFVLILIIIIGNKAEKKEKIKKYKKINTDNLPQADTAVKNDKIISYDGMYYDKSLLSEEEKNQKVEEALNKQYDVFIKDAQQPKRPVKHNIYPSEEELKQMKERKALIN